MTKTVDENYGRPFTASSRQGFSIILEKIYDLIRCDMIYLLTAIE